MYEENIKKVSQFYLYMSLINKYKIDYLIHFLVKSFGNGKQNHMCILLLIFC